MKAKFIYKEGVVYEELPKHFWNRQRFYKPRKDFPSAITTAVDLPDIPTNNEHVFEHFGFENINGELHKVLKEV